MSSSKSWIVQSARRRIGWTLVIAGAAFIAALVVGDSLVAAFVAIVVVVAASALIPNRGTSTSKADYPSERSRGAPYVVSYFWKVNHKPDLSTVVRALDDAGLRLHRKVD